MRIFVLKNDCIITAPHCILNRLLWFKSFNSDGSSNVSISCSYEHLNQDWRGRSVYHYSDVIISAMASQITGVFMVCSTVCSEKASKLNVTGLCEGNSPVTGEFPSQRASNAQNVLFDDVIMFSTTIFPQVCSHRRRNQSLFLHAKTMTSQVERNSALTPERLWRHSRRQVSFFVFLHDSIWILLKHFYEI